MSANTNQNKYDCYYKSKKLVVEADTKEDAVCIAATAFSCLTKKVTVFERPATEVVYPYLDLPKAAP